MLQQQLFYPNLVAFSYERKNREEHWKVSSDERIFLFYSWLHVAYILMNIAQHHGLLTPHHLVPLASSSFPFSPPLGCSLHWWPQPIKCLSHPVLCILFPSVTTSINLCGLFNTATNTYCILKVLRSVTDTWCVQLPYFYLLTSLISVFCIDSRFRFSLMYQNMIGKHHM